MDNQTLVAVYQKEASGLCKKIPKNLTDLGTDLIGHRPIEYYEELKNEMRDHDLPTYEHCMRVGMYMGLWARSHNVNAQTAKTVALLGFLHDIGKLNWPQKYFTPAMIPERARIAHTIAAQKRLSVSDAQEDEFITLLAKTVALLHHENPGATGYFEIPSMTLPDYVQIAQIADIFDTLTVRRSYDNRRSFSCKEALKHMQDENTENGGKSFNPALLTEFICEVSGKSMVSAYPEAPFGSEKGVPSCFNGPARQRVIHPGAMPDVQRVL